MHYQNRKARLLFENLACCRESQNCVLCRCSNCPGQSHLKTITEELFEANDFDVEDSIVCKQWVHCGHTKVVFITNSPLFENLLKKFAEQQIKQKHIIMQQNHKFHI
jgi:hypothetical protein